MDSISKMMSNDGATEKKVRKSPQQKAHEEEIQNAILVLAAEVIRCDHNYTSETEQQVQQFLAKQFGGVGAKQRLKQLYAHLDTGTEPFTRMACKELKMLATHDSILHILHFLFAVAGADDFVNAKETRRIQRIATYLGVSEKDFREIKQQFLSENNPYRILGVDEEATWEQVRKAYRKMILKSHPDKKDASVTEHEANTKFRDVQRAFETIKAQREKDQD